MNYILIGDDVTDNCIFLQLLLETEGYNAEFVTFGSEVINHVRLQKPDLLLLDIMMPDMSGFEVVRIIREDQDLQNLPILIVTAHKEWGEPQLNNVQVNGIIYKPVDFDLLIQSVQQSLQS